MAPAKPRRKLNPKAVPEWVPRAWEMRTVRMLSWEHIAAEVQADWRTVKTWVVSYSHMLAEVADDEDTINARAEYIESLQGIKRATEETASTTENEFARIAALNTKLRACEKLAAAKGVSTEKVTQVAEGALTLNFADNLTPEEQVESARLLAKASNGQATELPDGLPEVTGPAEGGA